MEDNFINSNEYKTLKESDIGKSIIASSKNSALNLIFDYSNNSDYKKLSKLVSGEDLFDLVHKNHILEVVIENEVFNLTPYITSLDEEKAFELLWDAQAEIESSMFKSVLMERSVI